MTSEVLKATSYEAAFELRETDKWLEVIASSTPYASALTEVFDKVTRADTREVESLIYESPNRKTVALAGCLEGSEEDDVLVIETDGSNVNYRYWVKTDYSTTPRFSLNVDSSGEVRLKGVDIGDHLGDHEVAFLGLAIEVHKRVKDLRKNITEALADNYNSFLSPSGTPSPTS